MLLKFARERRAQTAPASNDETARTDYGAVIRDLASRASGIGREAAELYGTLEDLSRIGAEQARAFAALLREGRRLGEANLAIARAAAVGRRAPAGRAGQRHGMPTRGCVSPAFGGGRVRR